MSDNSRTNQAVIIGTIEGEPVLNHEIYSEAFYIFNLIVPRLSGNVDVIPVTASERLLADDNFSGAEVKITGQFRSRTILEDGKTHLLLTVFAKDIVKNSENDKENTNNLFLDGYICKPPLYRKSPLGREITDMFIAVNRGYKRSDYIPVIAWGRNARYSRNFKVGDHVHIRGRIQSREYIKHISDTESVKKTAYEVSANVVELIESEAEE